MREAMILCVLLMSFEGCSGDLVPVTDPDYRFACKGFSVLPPRGPGWSVARKPERIERQVTFFKRGPKPGHTIMACAFPLDGFYDDLDGLVKAVREQGGHAAAAPRLQNQKEQLAVEKVDGYPAIVCSQSGDDHGASGHAEARTTVTTRSWTFLDPRTRRACQLWISERVPHGETPLSIEAELQQFLHGFEFIPPMN